MSSNSRILNRGLLLLCGLLLGMAGVAAILAGTPARWPGSALPEGSVASAGSALSRAGTTAAGLPEVGGAPGVVVGALGIAALLAVLLVVFLSTRGARRVATVVSLDGKDGRTSVDRDVAEAVLAGPLGERSEVLSARTAVYRVKGAPAIRLVVTVRRGADLPRVLAAAEEVLQEWDALAGTRVPVLVHLSDRSWLDGLRSATRVR